MKKFIIVSLLSVLLPTAFVSAQMMDGYYDGSGQGYGYGPGMMYGYYGTALATVTPASSTVQSAYGYPTQDDVPYPVGCYGYGRMMNGWGYPGMMGWGSPFGGFGYGLGYGWGGIISMIVVIVLAIVGLFTAVKWAVNLTKK